MISMACETAVVASGVGGIPEIVVDGEIGYLVDHDSDHPEPLIAPSPHESGSSSLTRPSHDGEPAGSRTRDPGRQLDGHRHPAVTYQRSQPVRTISRRSCDSNSWGYKDSDQ